MGRIWRRVRPAGWDVHIGREGIVDVDCAVIWYDADYNLLMP